MTDSPKRDTITERINQLVPTHTFYDTGTWTWTTPHGLWRIENTFDPARLITGPVGASARIITVTGRNLSLALPAEEDCLDAIITLLRNRGAFEDNPPQEGGRV
jgi:hypothetical protein